MYSENLKCKNCKQPERHPGCHSTCEYYIEWKKEHDKIEAEIKKQKWLNNISIQIKSKRK